MNHHHLISCESTSLFIKENFTQHPFLISCEKLLQARGRGSNKWDVFKDSLTIGFSFGPITEGGLVALEVGVKVCEFLRNKYKKKVMLKWPNDLYLDDKKIGGVLVESFRDTFIVGIGINMYLQTDEKFGHYRNQASSLLDSTPSISKQELAQQLYQSVLTSQLINIPEVFSRLCMHINRSVEIFDGDNCHGIFKGINSDGSALIQTNTELRSVYSGSLRIID